MPTLTDDWSSMFGQIGGQNIWEGRGASGGGCMGGVKFKKSI